MQWNVTAYKQRCQCCPATPEAGPQTCTYTQEEVGRGCVPVAPTLVCKCVQYQGLQGQGANSHKCVVEQDSLPGLGVW